MKKHALITAALLSAAVAGNAAGYQLNLQGLRQLAMGGGGTAYPWDAATLFYNPAGLSRLNGFEVQGSVLFLMPRTQFIQSGTTGGSNERAVNQTFTPFNVYAGGTITKDKRLGIGIGIYTPFGSGVKWDDHWTGRYINQNILLQSFFVQPTVSYRLNDYVSIGAGYVYAFGNVKIQQAVPVTNANGDEGQATLKGNADGMGYNVGISVKASEKWSFGITYRSRVDMHVKDGDVTFANIPQAAATTTNPSSGAVTQNFPNTKFDATLPLPEVLSVGAAFKPIPKLTIQADFNLTGWKAYDTLSFNYSQAVNGSMRNSSPRTYHNRLASRLGLHYDATQALEIMAGGAYDPSPAQDGYVSPDLPDANRIVLTCGLAIRPTKHFAIMAALEYVTSAKRNATYIPEGFSGTYQTKALTPGIGLSYTF